MSVPRPRSPLEDHLPPGHHGVPGVPGVTLGERRATLREVFARRGQAGPLGLPGPGRAVPLWGGIALAIAPGACLLMDGNPPALPREVAAVVDQTGGFVILQLGGPAAAEALARICRLDLHETAFPEGSVARTPMAQVPVILHRAGANAFELVVPGTLAVSFTHSLLHAAIGFGCAILPPVTPRDAP